MLSRISNAEVRRIAKQKPLTQTLLYRQLALLGKIARAPNDSDLRAVIFQPDSLNLQVPAGKRNIGRPRLRWETIVYAHAVSAAGSVEDFNTHVIDQKSWQQLVRNYSYSH